MSKRTAEQAAMEADMIFVVDGGTRQNERHRCPTCARRARLHVEGYPAMTDDRCDNCGSIYTAEGWVAPRS